MCSILPGFFWYFITPPANYLKILFLCQFSFATSLTLPHLSWLVTSVFSVYVPLLFCISRIEWLGCKSDHSLQSIFLTMLLFHCVPGSFVRKNLLDVLHKSECAWLHIPPSPHFFCWIGGGLFKAAGGSLKTWLVLFYYIISRPLSQRKCVLSSLGFDAAGGMFFLLPHVPSCHVTSQTPLILASFVLLALDWCYVKATWVWRLSLVPALQPWISFGFLSLVVNTNMSSWESSSIMLRKRHGPRWPGLSFVLGVWCDVNPVLKDRSWGLSLKSCRLVQCVPVRAFLAPGQACAFCCEMSNILGSCS